MDIMLLIFVINLISLAFGILSFQIPFMALVGILISLTSVVMNISSLTGIYLTFSITTIFINAFFLALAVYRSGDFYS